MSTEPNRPAESPDHLEMPAPTLWPIVLSAGITLMGAGFVTNGAFTIVGAVIFVIALANWINTLLPGQGTGPEELAPPEERARPVREHPGAVEHLRPGMAGHRMRIPEKVHPYSAGARGGLIGGLVMPAPAFVYGLVSKHGIWYPINLLAGMVVPLPNDTDLLQQFHLKYFVVAVVVHLAVSVGLGLMYGVLLPMLPGKPMVWGGLVAPLLWTGATYGFIGVLNPVLADNIDWPSFVVSQFIYGITVGFVVLKSEKIYAEEAGVPEIIRRARPTMRIPPGGENQ